MGAHSSSEGNLCHVEATARLARLVSWHRVHLLFIAPVVDVSHMAKLFKPLRGSYF